MSDTKIKHEDTQLSPLALKIIFAVMAVAIIMIYVYLKGNPLVGMRLNKESDQYFQNHYSEIYSQFSRSANAYFIKDDISIWHTEKQEYILAEGTWIVTYEKNDNSDTYINFVYSRDGEMIYDSCGEKYLNGGTIYEKLSSQYNIYIEKIYTDVYSYGLPNTEFSYSAILESDFASGYFENTITNKQALGMWPVTTAFDQYTGPVLDINKEYRMEDLAKQYGVVVFNFEDEKNVYNLYTRCLEVREIIEEFDLPFNKICITLGRDNGLYNITREDLFCEDLMEFIKNNYTVM
ncbi:MAG: hypothetical protein IKU54_04515 [Oscillospiraceae bacterium]|nr:hypothetical protein [Oscillospiraceae bacterium]